MIIYNHESTNERKARLPPGDSSHGWAAIIILSATIKESKMTTTIKRIPEQSYHIKDKLAGYYRWRIDYICTECGKRTSDNLHGTREDIEGYVANPINRVCIKCQR